MRTGKRFLAMAAMAISAVTLVLAAPAGANTGPTVQDCERSFAAAGLLAIRQFQGSNKSPDAVAILGHQLNLAELNFNLCLGLALS